MKPLRICFLWHQHQPYYRKEDKFILPWVRFHAIKDYLDLPSILFEFPEIKQTFNIVPSLLLQIFEYTKSGVIDRVQELSLRQPSDLNDEEKNEIEKQFFVCNFQNLIAPYPRYLELYNKVSFGNKLNEQELIDLQVWYNLAWTGQITRKRPQFKRYFSKGKGFTQKEKELLLESQLNVLKEIVPTMKQLYELDQVELSVSPFFHPILPLLCDATIAKIGLPNLELNEPIFKFPEDAVAQVVNGKKFFQDVFGFEPKGVWPSEGSLSSKVLDIFADEKFEWTATDSKLLYQTLNSSNSGLQYFPYIYQNGDRRIVVFFRDSFLSDAIGFNYQNWKTEDAVFDFVNRLKMIRTSIIGNFGEDALDFACVPIILDGENCWEYYKDNGLPFLLMLYKTISSETCLRTFTFSEIVNSLPRDYTYVIQEIFPGSWINANFYTWIGQPQKQIAWNQLAKARYLIEQHKENNELYAKAMDYAFVAEGSDWFWWYGDDNIAPNKTDFDKLFRWYLTKIYQLLGVDVPFELQEPLGETNHLYLLTFPTKTITESNIRTLSTEIGWGLYYAKSAIGTMHSNKAFISEIYFGNTKKMFLIGLKILREIQETDKVFVYLTQPKELKLQLTSNEFAFFSPTPIDLRNFYFAFGEYFVLGIDFSSIFSIKDNYSGSILEFFVKTENELGEMIYPMEGTFTYIVV